ncbi:MAG: Rne/Rng family ribonuclease [Phycisphaerales bacterium]|nr:Rne/Rng family ribonuclease [Phycisphaerales bacterium]MCB9835957.1 Rne/Rng family ribonuclease [Phycisphaera sp.]
MPKHQMLISYQPGEECRVAILEDGILEDYHTERPATANRVNNLYLGKVTNIESSLQAAFVDFGGPESAFLHTSDIHPMYFPEEDGDTTEKIGKKTARRDRPPIQQCLKRGQKIVVQILKDGVGTKGPAATTYLSIPGKYLVMMPQMDNVGVSRKMEDEDKRRQMRETLDSIDLPEGFGFILRTAGFGRNKTELKRDLAYLQRLWKDIEKRRKSTSKPSLLYAESDLLVRALRDLLTTEIDEVVIDHEQGLARAANFLKVVAPRTGIKLRHYNQRTPMYHAFGIEEQVHQMITREVPLPSGGRLVIDETEAVVAIDVNSGKSRKAKDAETNAYQTNLEAVDVICRQLKLRELGGLVINDLIDMNQAKHRKAIEARFKDRLKRDRAKSTILPISQFGIMEMTRQRMRPSAQGTHYTELPPHMGRGWVRKPESLAAEALRELALILSFDKVKKAELVVPGRVAGELLSSRRRTITRMELVTQKTVLVRVSDQLGTERFSVYAYDEAGNDIDIATLPKPKAPKELPEWTDSSDDRAWDEISEEEDLLQAIEDVADPHPIELDAAQAASASDDDDDDEQQAGGKKKRRRRRRGGRGRKRGGDKSQEGEESADSDTEDKPASEGESEEAKPTESADESESSDTDAEGDDKPKKKRRRRRGKKRSTSGDAAAETGDRDENAPNADDEAAASADTDSESASADDAKPEGDDEAGGKKKRRRRRGGRGKGKSSDAGEMGETSNGKAEPEQSPPTIEVVAETPKPKKPRTLYGGSRRKLKPSEKAAISDE